MKNLLIVLLLLVGMVFSQPVFNFPIIRTVGVGEEKLEVRKFEDGPNTCYVAHSLISGYAHGQAVSISCVKR
jgi:hypothetical protein